MTALDPNLPRPDSLSSSLMLGITAHRNQPSVLAKLHAQIAYPLTFVVAIVETAVALAFTLLSLPLNCLSGAPTQASVKWLKSSAFSVLWSLADTILNLGCSVLVVDEKSAREIFFSGNLLTLPQGAVL